MSLLINITACGKPTGSTENDPDNNNADDAQVVEAKNYKAGVIDASELFVKNGVAFWGYGPQLCSALLDENGDLYEFVSEGSLSGEIYSIAIDGSNMYMATENGIVCLPLEKAESEQSQLSVIDDHELTTSSFQIYDENIYFTYGRRLYLVPEDGGDNKTLEENIEAFQVTTEGIYCINSNGDLLRVSLDGTERKTLCELDSEGEIFILNDTAYITTGDDKDYVYVYQLEEDTVEKLHFEKDLSPYHPAWVTENCIYYESDDYEIFRYDFESETESQSDALYDLPDYDAGYLENDIIYYIYSDYLYWMHLDSGESVKLGKEEALEGTSVSGSTSGTTTAGSTTAGNNTNQNSDYNIAENIGVYNSEEKAANNPFSCQ